MEKRKFLVTSVTPLSYFVDYRDAICSDIFCFFPFPYYCITVPRELRQRETKLNSKFIVIECSVDDACQHLVHSI